MAPLSGVRTVQLCRGDAFHVIPATQLNRPWPRPEEPRPPCLRKKSVIHSPVSLYVFSVLSVANFHLPLPLCDFVRYHFVRFALSFAT
jgi:hypothetical protein